MADGWPGRGTAPWALALALAACFPGAALAATPCPQQTLHALAAEGLIPADGHAAPVAQACRAWPFDPSLALAAVAYPLPERATAHERSLRLIVAMLDARDSRPLAIHETGLEEDAAFELGPDGLRLDTARYDLAPGVRAFGVVVRNASRNPSCPEGRSNDALTLYVRDGATLRPVFSSDLYIWQQVEGEVCAWTDREQRLVTEQATLSIGVEPGASNGYADLRVMADVERITREAGASWDEAVHERRRRSRVVRYDGDRYDTRALRDGAFWAAPLDE